MKNISSFFDITKSRQIKFFKNLAYSDYMNFNNQQFNFTPLCLGGLHETIYSFIKVVITTNHSQSFACWTYFENSWRDAALLADLQFFLFYCEKLNRNLPYSVVYIYWTILGGRARQQGQILVTRKYIYGSAPMPPRTEWLKRSETVNEIHQYRAKVIYPKY